LHFYLTSKNILRASQKNKFRCEFNPNPEKVADIIPIYFSTRCPSGEDYEKEFSEDADIKPSRDFNIFLVSFG
jgi:hypothetical protein